MKEKKKVMVEAKLASHSYTFAHGIWRGRVRHVIGACIAVRALETGDASAFADRNRVAGLALRMSQVAGSCVDCPVAVGGVAQVFGHWLCSLTMAVAGGRVDDDGAIAEFRG